MKLWAGRFSKEADKVTNDINASIGIDKRMWREDIEGSLAHSDMLAECGIISKEDRDKISEGLRRLADEIAKGETEIADSFEDIHSFVEGILTERIGDAGKRLHTARSRNDQVAVDIRLTLRNETDGLLSLVDELIEMLADLALQHSDVVMPGYTHLQRAQPVTFGHHLLAYAEMLLRDRGRLDAKRG